ncbi:MAG TPA: tetratricopeptide repeat protein, partial [Bryobacteraceae bacterium]|nr:tetratricopeptide repeat protein [Bryobacteraceae bacterium]
MSRVVYWGAVVAVCVLPFCPWVMRAMNRAPANAASTSDVENQLSIDRNLGKAFYENPTTQAEAVAEFKKALDLKPDSVREQLNYALALLRDAKTPQAVALLQKVQKEDPSLPHTWFNLGIYYKRAGNFDKSLEQFQQMAKLVPSEPITHYNLGSIYKLQNKLELAQKEFELAR